MTSGVAASIDLVLVLGAFAGMLAGFFAVIRFMIGQGSTDREADRAERSALTQAMAKMAKSNALIARETRKGNQEAKTRNGHLGEQNIHLAMLVTDQNKDVSKIKQATAQTADILSKSALIAAEDRDLLTNHNQVIREQKVEHQTVRKLD